MKFKHNCFLLAKSSTPAGGGGKGPNTAKEAPKEALAKVEPNELSQDILDDIVADAGAGAESMGKDDLAIPRIVILQGLSPQVQKRTETYVEGAEAGEIFDTVSQAIFSGEEGIQVIPCTYRKTYLEWKPREAGGGLVADHCNDESILKTCTRNEKGQYVNGEGNNIVPTAEYYVLLVDPDSKAVLPYVLSMSGANLKHSKRWNSLINMLRIKHGERTINPAMFYRTYRLVTSPESNDQGSWFGWKISGDENVIDLPDGHDKYLYARSFRESVLQGAVKAAEHTQDAPAQEKDDAPM